MTEKIESIAHALQVIDHLHAEVEALRTALAHYATDESADGWIAIAALRGDHAAASSGGEEA